jgi:hypothetical protein
MNELVLIAAQTTLPTLIAASGERPSLRFLEFFAANIRNPHTRRAYGRAVAEFMAWCEDNHVPSITDVQPLHVAAWIEQPTREHAAPTAKLRLAALRHLFRLAGDGPGDANEPGGIGARPVASSMRGMPPRDTPRGDQ